MQIQIRLILLTKLYHVYWKENISNICALGIIAQKSCVFDIGYK